MFDINITENELDKIKVLADFLLFDQHSERVSFPRFEYCLGLLTIEQKFSLKDIFIEICGSNKKYINFSRLLRAFCQYKSNSIDKSVEFKKFFSYIFNEIIKDIQQIPGREIKGSTYFSTQIHKHRECISNVKVYTNKENHIHGISIEYDGLFKNEFIVPNLNANDLIKKIDLSLKVLKDFDCDGELDEDHMRDFITHVYGYYTTKIESIGFKCSSGKQYFTGNPNGKPFLLGRNASKLHYIKLALKDESLTYIKPYFVENNCFNYNLDFELREITQELLTIKDEQYEDEIYLKDITDPKEYKRNVLIPLVDDNLFFNQDKDDCCGDNVNNIFPCESFCSSEENSEDENQHVIEEDFLSDVHLYMDPIKAGGTKSSTNKFSVNKKLPDIKNMDLETLSRKIEILQIKIQENIFDQNTKNAVLKKLDYLKSEKSKLVIKKVENLKKNILKKSKTDVKSIKNKTDENRKRQVEQKKKEAKLKELKGEEQAKKRMVPPVTFGKLKIPKNIEIYRSQEIVIGTEFIDDKFPPNKSSLCPFDPKNKEWLAPQGIEVESDLLNWETYQWERVDKIFRTDDYQVFFKGIEANDIIQGSLGDCYFLSAIAGLCRFPELVEKLFFFKEKSIDRCYGVYLRINGLWELVLLDDYVPCYGLSRKKFAFSNANGNEIWVILLEKAWAKINGSYAKAIAGEPAEVFDAISNSYTETTKISPQLKEFIWLKIVDGKNNEYIMTAGTGINSENIDYESVNLVEGHAYTLLGCEEIYEHEILTKLVKLRNPWGSGEWSGNWSDSSNKWTPKLREKLLGKEEDDGVFFMSFEDFLKYYVTLGICKIHRNFHYSYLKFKKNSSMNPQLMTLELKKKSKCFIQLHQKNPRFLLSNGKYGEPTLSFLLLLDKSFNFISSASGDTRNITIEVNLNPGLYYLYSDINYRYIDINDLHGYNITTYSENPISLSICNSYLNKYDVLRKGLINYSIKNFEPITENELNIYSFISLISNFNSYFIVFENKSSTEIEIDFNLIPGIEKQSCCLFPETEIGSVNRVSKKISPNQITIFICLKFTKESIVECMWKAKSLLKEDQIEKITLRDGIAEALDEDGHIIQRYYQYYAGYGLILENTTTELLKMKLEVENLSYNNKIQGKIFFELKAKCKKFFNLKIVSGAKNVSFNFDFDD